MSNNFFTFRQFSVHQQRCAMKVGTDGVLLGAWAEPNVGVDGRNARLAILDIGTGTGLIALMLAQRFPNAIVDAIDLSSEAIVEARENVQASPFRERVCVEECAFQSYKPSKKYDLIVSNPPFFVDSLHTPDANRTMARHADTLTYRDLFRGASRLLSDHGVFAAIIPSENIEPFLSEACISGFFVSRELRIRTTPKKPVRRLLMAFTPHASENVEITDVCLTDGNGGRSLWYDCLTKDFYLPHPPPNR